MLRYKGSALVPAFASTHAPERNIEYTPVPFVLILIINIKMHSSCEIEYDYFVETHLCKLCVILRSSVLRVVYPQYRYRSATPLATTVKLSMRVNMLMLGSLCVETLKPVSQGDKI